MQVTIVFVYKKNLTICKLYNCEIYKCDLILCIVNYQTDTLFSRSASFSDVFKSVDALRFPIINAHGTSNVPAGNFLG